MPQQNGLLSLLEKLPTNPMELSPKGWTELTELLLANLGQLIENDHDNMLISQLRNVSSAAAKAGQSVIVKLLIENHWMCTLTALYDGASFNQSAVVAYVTSLTGPNRPTRRDIELALEIAYLKGCMDTLSQLLNFTGDNHPSQDAVRDLLKSNATILYRPKVVEQILNLKGANHLTQPGIEAILKHAIHMANWKMFKQILSHEGDNKPNQYVVNDLFELNVGNYVPEVVEIILSLKGNNQLAQWQLEMVLEKAVRKNALDMVKQILEHKGDNRPRQMLVTRVFVKAAKNDMFAVVKYILGLENDYKQTPEVVNDLLKYAISSLWGKPLVAILFDSEFASQLSFDSVLKVMNRTPTTALWDKVKKILDTTSTEQLNHGQIIDVIMCASYAKQWGVVVKFFTPVIAEQLDFTKSSCLINRIALAERFDVMNHIFSLSTTNKQYMKAMKDVFVRAITVTDSKVTKFFISFEHTESMVNLVLKNNSDTLSQAYLREILFYSAKVGRLELVKHIIGRYTNKLELNRRNIIKLLGSSDDNQIKQYLLELLGNPKDSTEGVNFYWTNTEKAAITLCDAVIAENIAAVQFQLEGFSGMSISKIYPSAADENGFFMGLKNIVEQASQWKEGPCKDIIDKFSTTMLNCLYSRKDSKSLGWQITKFSIFGSHATPNNMLYIVEQHGKRSQQSTTGKMAVTLGLASGAA